MTKIIDGKLISGLIRDEIAVEVRKMMNKDLKVPHLAAVLVGDDPASHTYVGNKEKACQEVGFMSSIYKYPVNLSEAALLEIIDFLNNDPEIDGFIVQLPLPGHISVEKVLERIDPRKDVDGFHPINIGRMVQNMPCYLPATPFGIMQLIDRYEIETEGKHCVVLGRSQIVGTPVSLLMSRKHKPGNATVTICHSKTPNIKDICLTADILIVAMGQAGFVTADMVKDGAVVIDVGTNRIEAPEKKSGYRLVGDVLYEEVAPKCSFITPVPGGVGPMTIVSLLMNTLKAAKNEIYG
jgi:methylenetetrahydrofolate dehydrogenase (NADP+) / methenyltetrahydrofolate cyclohydrolase